MCIVSRANCITTKVLNWKLRKTCLRCARDTRDLIALAFACVRTAARLSPVYNVSAPDRYPPPPPSDKLLTLFCRIHIIREQTKFRPAQVTLLSQPSSNTPPWRALINRQLLFAVASATTDAHDDFFTDSLCYLREGKSSSRKSNRPIGATVRMHFPRAEFHPRSARSTRRRFYPLKHG